MFQHAFTDYYLCMAQNATWSSPGDALLPKFSSQSSLQPFLKNANRLHHMVTLLGSLKALGALVSIIILTLSFLILYISTWRSFKSQISSKDAIRVPPILPYMIPYVGSAIEFGISPAKFFRGASHKLGSQTAYGIRLLGHNLYVIHGTENIAAVWKYKTSITSPGVQIFCLVRVFNMALKAVNAYNRDDSGIQQTPLPQSNVAPHNRLDFHTHASFTKLLSGDGLSKLYLRWSQSFACRLQSLKIGEEWMDSPDIMEFWMSPLTASLNEALAGPLLESINPNFTRDFIKFFPYVHSLMKGVPGWCIPEAVRLRDSLTHDVKRWQDIARARFKESDVESDGDADPWWGSLFFRDRQSFLTKVDGWDHDAVASSDFGLLWGANINVHTAAIWTIIEIFKDEKLLSRVRAELKEAHFSSFTSKDDIDKLLLLPLLQSVYAEVLRLRVEVQQVLCSDREDIQLNQWRIPRKSLILVPTLPAHMDDKSWNTRNGQYPLNTFWSDRFLVYRNDPFSGPINKFGAGRGCGPGKTPDVAMADSGKPKFKESGMADFFIPYGVGERTCPGRFFARREIVAFCATIVNDFDIELLTGRKEPEFRSSETFYGLGTQRPLGCIPFKIRKRKAV